MVSCWRPDRIDVLDVAVSRVQVFPSVVIVVDEAGAPAGERRAELPQRGLLGIRTEKVAAIAVKSARSAPSGCCRRCPRGRRYRSPWRRCPSTRPPWRVVVVGDAQRQALLLERAVALVDEQRIRLGIVGDEDVRTAVAVEIGDGDSHSFAGRGGEARISPSRPRTCRGPGCDRAACGTLGVESGIAVIFHALRRAPRVGLRSPDRVVGDHQVQQAVVDRNRTRPRHAQGVRRLAADARLRRDIGEGSVAIVVIERVPAGAARRTDPRSRRCRSRPTATPKL